MGKAGSVSVEEKRGRDSNHHTPFVHARNHGTLFVHAQAQLPGGSSPFYVTRHSVESPSPPRATTPRALSRKLRTTYCAACDRWLSEAPRGHVPGFATDAALTCTAAAGNGTCIGAALGADCPAGFVRCDAAAWPAGAASDDTAGNVADVAMSNGMCKRYRSAFAIGYNAMNPLSNSSLVTLAVSVDLGANVTFAACDAPSRFSAGGGLACNYTRARAAGVAGPDGVTTTVALRGTARTLSKAMSEFVFCPRCALSAYTVSARLVAGDGGGAGCAPSGGLNMTIRASSSLAVTFKVRFPPPQFDLRLSSALSLAVTSKVAGTFEKRCMYSYLCLRER